MTHQRESPNRKMNIAQVIGDLRIGGAERLFVDLFNALHCEKKIVVLLNSTQISENLADCLDAGTKIYTIPVRKRSFVLDIFRLAKFLRAQKIDVVHTHMFWANLYGAIGSKMAGVPVTITSEHGRNEWKSAWHKWLEANVTSRLVDYRLCVSSDILEQRRDVDGVPGDKLRVVPNGTRVASSVRQERKAEMVIGSVGRLVKAKDFPTLVKAVAFLVEQGHPCRLQIVGEGPERKTIESAIISEGVQDVVELVGSQLNVNEWLSRWSIFASSSIQEGQPIALLEAMALGLPCVATAVGGVPDTLEDGLEGLIAQPGDPRGIARALARLIDDHQLRETLGSAAHRKVVNEFSIEVLAEKCQSIYQEALKSNQGTQRS